MNSKKVKPEAYRRPGDPPILVGSSDKATKILGWHRQYPNKRGNYRPRLAVASKTAWIKKNSGARINENRKARFRKSYRASEQKLL